MKGCMVRTFFLAVCSLFAPVSCALAGQTAEVIAVSGDVQLLFTDADDYVDAEEAVELEAGDRIRTGSNGQVTISFNEDNTNIVRVSEDSVAEIVLGSEEKLELTEGEAFASVSKLSSGSAFEIRTPTAVAGARGTDWVTRISDDETQVEAIDSTPYIKHIESSGMVSRKETLINPGQMSSVKRFQPPVQPRPMQTARLQHWKDMKPMMRNSARDALVRRQQRPAFDRAKFIEEKKGMGPGKALRSGQDQRQDRPQPGSGDYKPFSSKDPESLRPGRDRMENFPGQGMQPMTPGGQMLKERSGTLPDQARQKDRQKAPPSGRKDLQEKPGSKDAKDNRSFKPADKKPQLPDKQKIGSPQPVPKRP